MQDAAIGQQLRARRTAGGRTVASVAAQAGLSVPYIANLENGRGNPTTAALSRLAEALGARLVVTLAPADAPGEPAAVPAQPARSQPLPRSLARLGRSERFRRAAGLLAGNVGQDRAEFSVRLIAALATLGETTGRDLAEADWHRLVDALVLIAAHPAEAP